MRTLMAALWIGCSVAASLAFSGEPPAAAKDTAALAIEVADLRNAKGHLRLGVYDQAAGFPRERDSAVLWKTMEADAESRVFRLDLPPGEYAVVVLHDENGNKKLDTNPLGIPKEGHGVTNNPKPLYRGPTYAEARFDLPPEGATMTVSIQYEYH